MRSRAAILYEYGGPWSVEEFELDPDISLLATMYESGQLLLDRNDYQALRARRNQRSLRRPSCRPTDPRCNRFRPGLGSAPWPGQRRHGAPSPATAIARSGARIPALCMAIG